MRGAPPEDYGDHLHRNTTAEPGCTSARGGFRKKAAEARPWLLLGSIGQTQVLEAGKHAVMQRTGLTALDLRLLDPLLSYPSTILGRERAIVVNLEQIKAIITAQEVLLLNFKHPSVVPFVAELQQRISHCHHARKLQEAGVSGDDVKRSSLYNLEETQSRGVSPRISKSLSDKDEDGNAEGKQHIAGNRDGPKQLPIEFVALEACLEAACTVLDNEASTLGQEAYPALDKLAAKISTLNLETVRQIKSRLVAITGRVQKVRDELENLLDNDEDMAEMYLTEKLVQQQLEKSTDSSINEEEGLNDEAAQSDMDHKQFMIPADSLMDGNEDSGVYDAGVDNIEQLSVGSWALSKGRYGTHTSMTHSSISKQLDVEELEMLLEAYFIQIDGTLNELSNEYVDDTEDYINIMLDDKQNHLLQMGVTLSIVTLLVNAFIVVAAIFGMNIKIKLLNSEIMHTKEFLWTVGGSTIASLFLSVIAIAWCKHKGLLE